MKIVDYKIANMNYKNLIALYTKEDVMTYIHHQDLFINEDFIKCVRLFVNHTLHTDFWNIVSHRSKSAFETIYAFNYLYNKGFVDTIQVDEQIQTMLSQQLNTMLTMIKDNKVIFINNFGGYHCADLKNIEITYELDITEEQLKDFINNPKYVRKTKNDIYMIYYKGKLYKDIIPNHIYICHKHNIKEDECVKLIYHKGACEYGIKNLQLSPVYTWDKPLLSKQDLDKIEDDLKYLNNVLEYTETENLGLRA